MNAEKLNGHPSLNEHSPQIRKRALTWNFAISAEVPIQVVRKNDKTGFSSVRHSLFLDIYVSKCNIDIELKLFATKKLFILCFTFCLVWKMIS